MALWRRRIWKRGTLVAPSEGLKRLAEKDIPGIPIRVIPNGVDRALFCRRVKVLHSPARLLFVGRIIPRKRIDLLAQAARQLRANGAHAVLRVVGDGPCLPQLREAYPDVEWIGPCSREELVRHYDWADIYVSAAEHEGMSMAILEALACGCPVVAVRHEGLESLPSEWLCGADRLVDTVLGMIRQYPWCAGRVREIRILNWADVVKQYKSLYAR